MSAETKEGKSGRKILVVEDESDISKVLVKRLSVAGYEVVVAEDAYQGINTMHQIRPDLVILDLMMPAGGGAGFLKNMKSSSHLKFTPVVVLTGMSDPDYKQKILDAGVDAYLEKPYEPDELISTIQKCLLG